MTETAAAQLRRILLLIPCLADGAEHDAGELAARLGVERDTLMRDLRALVTRFDEPGGFVDGVQLFIAGDRVSLGSRTFLRPMRLTTSELSALELGLTMLRVERPGSAHGGDAIDRALGRLRRCLVEMPGDVADAGADGPRTMRVRYVRDAARALAERERERVPLAADGSLTLDHPFADVREAARQVLRHGADAEALEPHDVRAEVTRRLGVALRHNRMASGGR